MKADLLVLDGRHLLWRTSDAFRDLTAEVDGQKIATGGMYGFLSIAIRLRQRYTGRAVVAWEGRDNFRLALYPQYKGKDEEPTQERVDMISEMSEQERRLSRMLFLMGVDQYRGKGCEADDVIGRLAREHSERGEHVVLYSGDSDLRQLVCDGSVTAVSPGQRGPDTVYNEAAVESRHGVRPTLLAQLKALAGDSSDRIPGAPGIGPVTAAKLLNHYGSLNVVLEAARDIDKSWPTTLRHQTIVAGYEDQIRLYYKLTRIRTNLPWIRKRGKADQKRFVEALVAYKFRSLASPAELHALMSLGKAQ